MRTLLIGCREGNVLFEWMKVYGAGPRCQRLVLAPSQDDLNVHDAGSILSYLREHGPFDEIVYGAGYNHLEWIKDVIRTDHVNLAFQVNVIGFIEIISAHMLQFGEAPDRVVAIVSDSSRTPMRGSIAYSSSKAALVGAIKNMARELAPDTCVVGVSPGIIDDTPMTRYIDSAVPGFRGWDPEKAKEYEKSMIPMQRRCTKREVAAAITFGLEGPEYMSGTIIELTGGK